MPGMFSFGVGELAYYYNCVLAFEKPQPFETTDTYSPQPWLDWLPLEEPTPT
jgi:hypothetical protein